MSTERIQQILGVEKSKVSVNTDTFLKVNIEGKERLLPPGQINNIINVDEQFNIERENSTFYRILGTINPTISNPLFNLDDAGNYDNFTWKGFNYQDIITNRYRFTDPIYPNAIKNNLKENNGWFGYYGQAITNTGLCNYNDMEPKRQRFTFTPDIHPYNAPTSLPINNWEVTITYPHSIDSGHTMINNGIMIVEAIPVTVATRVMTAFGIACRHNLNIGDMVRITGTSGYDGDHVVVRTGLDNGDLKEYYFVVDLPPIGILSTVPTNFARMKRLFGGIESKYYFRIFKKIKTRNAPIIEIDDYDMYQLAFSENVYSDSITQFVFNEDIDVSEIKDNLGRPLSELYLTIVKTNSGVGKNKVFTDISAGIETPFIAELNTSSTNIHLLNIPAISKIHNGGLTPFTTHIALETSVSIANNYFYGDIVEYNDNEVKETVLADISHRFNTVNRETAPNITYITNLGSPFSNNPTPPTTVTKSLGPRQEGYYYKAHNLIKIRRFSAYIEQGDEFTVNMPDYAVNLGDGRYLWRDLLPIGTNEIENNPLDYPFLNGCHYMYDNYCFTLKRQDPFDMWNLYYSDFPADPLGETLTTKFNTYTSENVC
jgi:hypothetical protein